MENPLTIDFDLERRSLYIRMRPAVRGAVAATEEAGNGVLIDLGRRGEVVGIELLGSKAVTRLFAKVGKEDRLKALRPLAPKRRALARLLA